MTSLLEQLSRDPLYRFTIWVLTVQLVSLVTLIMGMIFLRWRRQRSLQHASTGLSIARDRLRMIASGERRAEQDHPQLVGLNARLLFQAAEPLLTRHRGETLTRLRQVCIQLGLKRYGLRMSQSQIWRRRVEGLQILTALGGSEARETLYHACTDPKGGVVFYAIWGLAQLDPRHAAEYIFQHLRERDDFSSRQQVQIISSLDLAYWVREQASAELPIDRLTPALLESLATQGFPAAGALIKRALEAPSVEVRVAALKAVFWMRLPLSNGSLLPRLRDESWPVRAQAVRVAGRLGHEGLTIELSAALADENWWVRRNAGDALRRLGKLGIESLQAAAAHANDRFAKEMARRALGEFLMLGSAQLQGQLKTTPLAEFAPEDEALPTLPPPQEQRGRVSPLDPRDERFYPQVQLDALPLIQDLSSLPPPVPANQESIVSSEDFQSALAFAAIEIPLEISYSPPPMSLLSRRSSAPSAPSAPPSAPSAPPSTPNTLHPSLSPLSMQRERLKGEQSEGEESRIDRSGGIELWPNSPRDRRQTAYFESVTDPPETAEPRLEFAPAHGEGEERPVSVISPRVSPSRPEVPVQMSSQTLLALPSPSAQKGPQRRPSLSPISQRSPSGEE